MNIPANTHPGIYSPKEHYEEFLADIYSWMCGDFNERVNQTTDYFIKYNIKPSSENSAAIDLGSGHGIQSAALAAIGFHVTAIDRNSRLLDELKDLTGGRVNTIVSDIIEYSYYRNNPELIICMGDTITHLNNLEEVIRVMNNSFKALPPKGKLIISYRDLSDELTGTGRFIHVKSDENRIFTCFLEYFEEFVVVNDILHQKVNGKWEMKVSSYRKLRIGQGEIENILSTSRFRIISSEQINGMLHIISKK